ncbi:hypothetical protein [uncultured Devosia sp.]|uniref:hypothetical protein n=1 Tax=uncultured Devosia sp. TaxID=211434 RepID=UPI00262EF37F|nr:hypothetical protein [uncultured Devosia sp.]
MNIETPSEARQLVTVKPADVFALFTTDNAIDPILAHIRKEIDAFQGDASTAKGRKAIASMAYTIAQSKTYLENIGKDLAAKQKEIPKKIDACRKTLRDTLDQWRDEVRAPLTAWEEAEESRIKKHTDAITALNELSRLAPGQSVEWLRGALLSVDAVAIGPACEEFEADYARAKDAARASITEELPMAEKREADAAELEKLRAESAARAEADRIAKIQQDAADKAKADAEAAAQAKIDQERAAATAKQQEAEQAKAAAEAEAARLKKEADDAAAAKAAEEAEKAKREANTRHKGKVNRAAADAFIAGGLTEDAAMTAVRLIAKGAIPACTITY